MAEGKKRPLSRVADQSGLSANHWQMRLGLFRERVGKKVYQQALKNGPYFVNGILCDVVGRLLGAGIYEVWMQEVTHAK